MRGRPLAFLVLVVTGWGVGRFIALLPGDVVEPLVLASERAVVPPAAAAELPAVAPPQVAAVTSDRETPLAPVRPAEPVGRRLMAPKVLAPVVVAAAYAPVTSDGSAATLPAASDLTLPGLPPTLPNLPKANGRSRWSGSAWAIVRDGSRASLLSPLLGGSQAGIRVAYRLDDANRIAVFARVAAPLKNGPADVAAGAQWRPTKAPVTLYAEVRATRGRAAPAVGAFGGGAIALPAKFRLEGYGQAGLIRRNGVSGFGDGQVRLARPIGPVEVGAGTWAAAQRGATRLDIGPSFALPIAADPIALRVALDWRHRVAGNARPASGPALSLGADF